MFDMRSHKSRTTQPRIPLLAIVTLLAIAAGPNTGPVASVVCDPGVRFVAAPRSAVGAMPVTATAADFNADGRLDLAIANYNAGTSMVQDIATGRTNSNPASFTLLGDRVLFSADNGSVGDELWAISYNELKLANSPDRKLFLPIMTR